MPLPNPAPPTEVTSASSWDIPAWAGLASYQFSRRGSTASDSSGEKPIAQAVDFIAVLNRTSGARGTSYSLAYTNGEAVQRNKVRVTAVVSGRRVAIDGDPYAASPCDPIKAQLRSDLADLALPAADRISIGQRWTDSLISDICVGGIPGRSQAWRQFQAVGDTSLAGDKAVIVARADSVAADASGALEQHVISLTGAGRTSARLYISETSGKILRVYKEQLLKISVVSAGRTKQFVQRSTSVAEIDR